MLDKLFMQILDMSITGSVVILVVLLARLLLKKAPKIISYGLWSVVLLRLLCPFSIQAPVSVMPQITPVEDTYELTDVPISIAGAGVAAYQAVGDVLNGGIGVQHIPTTNINELGNVEYVTTDWGDVWVLFGQYVWIVGVAAMIVHSAVSYWKLKKRIGVALHLRENIYLADEISSPFVIGLAKPKIYLPDSLMPQEQEYIIAHEQHHIRRCDHMIKVLAFLALTIHWFNPLVWLAFILASRDMEMSCDEAVVRKFGPEVRADYAASLLTLATGRRIIGGTPLAFGEGDPKGRIRNLSKWKKPVLWITAMTVILCAVLAVCLLTDPVRQDEGNITDPSQTEGTTPNTDFDEEQAQADLEKEKEKLEQIRQEAEATRPVETTEPVLIGPGSDIDFRMIALETKFPFIYYPDDEWLREYVGQFDFVNVDQLKPGAFYVLDFKTNAIRMLFETGVQIIRETPNTVFCVLDGRKLIRTDYYAEKIETIYEAQFGTIIAAERLDETMCLVEAGHVVCINLITYEVESVYACENAMRACLITPTQLVWCNEAWQWYFLDREAQTQRAITEVELNMLWESVTPQPSTTKPEKEEPPKGVAGVVTYDTELEDLPANYTPQQAAKDGCVVMIDGDVAANEDIWIQYTIAYSRGEPAKVRLAEYDNLVKVKRIYELVASKSGHLYRLLVDGKLTETHYKHLFLDGETNFDGGHYNMFQVYALSNTGWRFREGIPYDDSTWNSDAVMVFCNLYQRHDYAPIPHHLQCAEIRNQNGTVAVIWDHHKLEKLMELLAPAEGYHDWPKTVDEGATLILTGADGTKVEAMMMANGTMIEIDGVFYNYDPGWKEIYEVEDLLAIFDLAEMP